MPNLPHSHWPTQLFDLRAPSSTDVPVLLLNQPMIGTTTQREMRQRKSAEETEHDFQCSTFRSTTGLPWAPETFHARFPVSALSKSWSRTRGKNLSWNPGYGQARLRFVRVIVTVVAFSFLNLPELLVCFSPSTDGISTVAVTPFSPCMTVWLNTFITTASRVVKFLSKLVL